MTERSSACFVPPLLRRTLHIQQMDHGEIRGFSTQSETLAAPTPAPVLAAAQVLFREGVRGRLLTEARWWAGARGSLRSLYPPQRAARLASDMAALDASPHRPGEDAAPSQAQPSPLDQLRLIVTGRRRPSARPQRDVVAPGTW